MLFVYVSLDFYQIYWTLSADRAASVVVMLVQL